MFNSKLIHSLQARLGLAMAAILALAIVSIGSSVIITQTAKGFAAAINQAGTLRMQSYRIVASLVPAAGEEVLSPGVRTRSLVSEFRDRLASDRIQSVMQKNPSLPVQDSYRLLVERWESVLAPLISEYISQALAAEPSRLSPDRLTNLRQAYIAEVDPFVDVIHQFVRALEVEAESKIERLQLIQLIVLILTLVVVVVLLFVRRDLHRPMRELLATAGAVRHGDFSVRCSHPRDDELGQLGAAFNLMAADLSH
ncbi:type IV pili methyl-accepting chemotaxis transducer N-terminal domain-containing protein, partial [Solemya velum gill symbiont]